jgi:hypothetical protein
MSVKPSVVLSVDEWCPSMIRYMVPKLNKSGGKSISIISEQTKRSLHISTPLLMTWGISDYVNEDGNSDGKYTISLQFPSKEYETPAASNLLTKIEEFQNQILNDAVKNSDIWWGEKLELAVAKHTFFPILKYSKNSETKKIDYTKAPTFRAKVNNYDGVWNLEIYDVNQKIMFPNDNKEITPMDFVPKLSQVACVIQCGGIWIGGKGWGVTWKLVQCIVKPKEIVSIYGTCHVNLTDEDKETLLKNGQNSTSEFDNKNDDFVADSDDEKEVNIDVQTNVVVEKDAAIVEKDAAIVEVASTKKKVIKKVVKQT